MTLSGFKLLWNIFKVIKKYKAIKDWRKLAKTLVKADFHEAMKEIGYKHKNEAYVDCRYDLYFKILESMSFCL